MQILFIYPFCIILTIHEKPITRTYILTLRLGGMNGELGYELSRENQQLTIGEFEKLMAPWMSVPGLQDTNTSSPPLFSDQVLSGRYEEQAHVDV